MCSRARPVSPSASPRGTYFVGVGLLAQGKRPEARKEFEAALALMRENADSYDPEASDWMPQKAESMEQNP